ncbi:anterior pharynx defective 1 [Gonapodya sp. JEL0774]|nr:anterior pharynx defective 1 [Gonapodya sp. JEL0774]
MTLLSFFGCLLTAYSPALAIFFGFVANDAALALLAISSAFFWLLSLLISALIWRIIPPLQSSQIFAIVVAVAAQEVFRYLYYVLISRAQPSLDLVTPNPRSPLNPPTRSLVAGFGFGVANSLVTYVDLLAQSIGPGVVVAKGGAGASMVFLGAITSSQFTLLNIAWNMVAFEGYQTRSWTRVLGTAAAHLAASVATLPPPNSLPYGFLISIFVCSAILVLSTYAAYRDVLPKFSQAAREAGVAREREREQREQRMSGSRPGQVGPEEGRARTRNTGVAAGHRGANG